MKYLLGLAILAVVAGCATGPLTPDEQALKEERAFDREIREENFKRFTKDCNKQGGMVLVQHRGGVSIRGVPSRTDTVQCIPRDSLNKMMRR